MKYTFNLSIPWDLERFACREELLDLLQGFDGVELNWLGPDEKDLLPPGEGFGLSHELFPLLAGSVAGR